LCFDIDPHGEIAERDAAYRADRSDERSAKTLLERRLFAVALRDGEKVAHLRRAGERHEIDLIATKRFDQPEQRRRVLWQAPAIGHDISYVCTFAFPSPRFLAPLERSDFDRRRRPDVLRQAG
jgi:hypothetical protein